MRRILVICSALFLLVACSRQSASESGFRAGTPQAEILKQISKMNGRILKQTTNEVLAEVTPPEIKSPVQVQLTFVGGVLDRVYFVPRPQ